MLLNEHTGNPTLLAIFVSKIYRSIDWFDCLSYYRYSYVLSSTDMVSRLRNDAKRVIERSPLARADEPGGNHGKVWIHARVRLCHGSTVTCVPPVRCLSSSTAGVVSACALTASGLLGERRCEGGAGGFAGSSGGS